LWLMWLGRGLAYELISLLRYLVLGHGVVVMGVGGGPVPCLLGQGRLEPPSLLEVVWNSSVESFIMAHSRDRGPMWVKPMKVVPESFLPRERDLGRRSNR
jgi:hypothetical protein